GWKSVMPLGGRSLAWLGRRLPALERRLGRHRSADGPSPHEVMGEGGWRRAHAGAAIRTLDAELAAWWRRRCARPMVGPACFPGHRTRGDAVTGDGAATGCRGALRGG